MKVLITGTGGQVGRSLIASAPATFDLVAAAHSDLDITNAGRVGEIVAAARPDLIINAAAYTAVDLAESEPEEAFAVNAAGAESLAAAAASHDARMIQLSTDFVFDGTRSSPYPPQAEPRPLSVYGKTKLAGEQAVLRRLPRASIVLRTAWIYAPSGRNFVLTMLRLMRQAKPIRVVADQFGTPTSADSIAAAVWALAARPECRGVYHWTDSGVASWYGFALAIAEEALGAGLLTRPPELKPITTDAYRTAARRPAYSVLDSRATVQATGLKPLHWRDRLRDVLRDIAAARIED